MGPTPLDLITLGIAVFGAATGAGSLAWSIASHFLSGARVRCELVAGWMDPLTGEGVIFAAQAFKGQPHPPPQYSMTIVGVRARNRGRLPVSVSSWSIQLGSGVFLTHQQAPWNKPVPYLLGVGEEALWTVDLGPVLNAYDALKPEFKKQALIFGSVGLGTGDTVDTKTRLRADDLKQTASWRQSGP